MKRGCPWNLSFILEKAPPETSLAMAECYVKSPAGSFFLKGVQWPMPGTEGGLWKKSTPAAS